ncbi:MAG: hypothetical protein Q4D16_04450 [Eubacteriales bacterium]|nr:hypothetical protein [Eubacteriales bacterium]
MSKINALRLINLNYNNNAIRISDEIFHLNGESTLLSLRNGGGKSVLVQMMTAPFVHKRYRDAKDRPFESYFTTNKPSFIMVEWVLDQGAGYVLTGMMVRRSQDTSDQTSENLEMVNFVSEYQEPCLGDIQNLPVVEKGKKEIVLKNFSACRQLFETFKRDRSMKFFYYDMVNAAQSRQYFDKLKEYQIHYKEWETIIKKINLKESGLSDLFADCKDEKGLVEKWFLESVESKLNKDRNRMKEFQTILEKYVGQYKDNESKIKRRDTIRYFKEEASRIQEKAGIYQEAAIQETEQENMVVNFIAELNRLWEKTTGEHTAVVNEAEAIRQAIARVEYEKLSGEIYDLEDKERYHSSNREMIAMEQDNLEREAESIEKKIHLLACAKQQGIADEDKKELEVLRQKLLVCRQKDKNLEPERKRLGYMLKCHYQEAVKDNRHREEECREKIRQTTADLEQEKEKILLFQKEILEKAGRQGELRSKTETYGQREERYNSRYEEKFLRNILGEYEPGFMEITQQSYEQELERSVRERTSRKKMLDSSRERHRQLKRNLDDLRAEQIHKKAEQEKNRQLKEKYDGELEEREVVLRYLGLDKQDLFHNDIILQASEKKLLEIAGIRRSLEKEEDELQKEYSRLTQGRVLELPEEFESELENLGIHVVFGMEWLNKNGNTPGENQKLVDKHPFLPYALILSAKELEKLSLNISDVYTSFPIPIIVREQLEGAGAGKKDRVLSFSGVSFYVLFNENLLDEEKLAVLVAEKARQIKKKQEAVSIRQTEYREYFQRQELIKNQEVSKARYEALENSLEETALEMTRLDEEFRNLSQQMAELEKDISNLEEDINKAVREIEGQRRRLEDFSQLCKEYEDYLACRKELERCIRDTEKLKEKEGISQSRYEKLQELCRSLESERDGLEMEYLTLRDGLRRYQTYEEVSLPEGDGNGEQEREIQEMEARYQAITSAMSQELHELEEQERKAARRSGDSEDELKHLKVKYGLRPEEWMNIRYNRKEESHQEILLEDRRNQIEGKKMLWNDEDKKIAVISQQILERKEKMRRECGQEEPLPKAEIQSQDFDSRKNQLLFQENEINKRADKLKMHLQSYDENLTALCEYTELKMQKPVVWEQNIEDMTSQELRNFKGILIRDYNQRGRDRQAAKEQLVHVLNQLVRIDVFQEDFYKKPLEAMLELTNDADQVILQLNTTIQSYDSLMEKLEVDISMVEKEKNKIVEILEDYIKEVHQNLGKIDHNSTITIRERPVKMLKIQIPEWEENESLYRIRLQDFIDQVTQKGISIFRQNENAQEYFGTQITTRNLYDTIVGIGNVQIRLYKIEEQREYPITWAEVARNSGGEGFLSAFVILSSLLYYMRKDDTDIFGDRNEGKVLVMDNPFAQTNASHLLKPLMDIARKTNTQLICLTGLGGESIYNRFDNIYVLNLITASLRNGMQYLKADHMRGSEPETMVLSQIQVMEQQSLIF